MIHVVAGTVVIYADIACPWATLCMVRLWAARERAGLVDDVRLDWRAFPLELFNARPTPRQVLDTEIPVVGAREPEFGWSPWRGKLDQYAVSTLLALEAVQAARSCDALDTEQLLVGLDDGRAAVQSSGIGGPPPVTTSTAAPTSSRPTAPTGPTPGSRCTGRASTAAAFRSSTPTSPPCTTTSCGRRRAASRRRPRRHLSLTW